MGLNEECLRPSRRDWWAAEGLEEANTRAPVLARTRTTSQTLSGSESDLRRYLPHLLGVGAA